MDSSVDLNGQPPFQIDGLELCAFLCPPSDFFFCIHRPPQLAFLRSTGCHFPPCLVEALWRYRASHSPEPASPPFSCPSPAAANRTNDHWSFATPTAGPCGRWALPVSPSHGAAPHHHSSGELLSWEIPQMAGDQWFPGQDLLGHTKAPSQALPRHRNGVGSLTWCKTGLNCSRFCWNELRNIFGGKSEFGVAQQLAQQVAFGAKELHGCQNEISCKDVRNCEAPRASKLVSVAVMVWLGRGRRIPTESCRIKQDNMRLLRVACKELLPHHIQ